MIGSKTDDRYPKYQNLIFQNGRQLFGPRFCPNSRIWVFIEVREFGHSGNYPSGNYPFGKLSFGQKFIQEFCFRGIDIQASGFRKMGGNLNEIPHRCFSTSYLKDKIYQHISALFCQSTFDLHITACTAGFTNGSSSNLGHCKALFASASAKCFEVPSKG